MSLTDYERPSLTTDIALFRVIDGAVESKRRKPEKILQVLLIRRDTEPFKGVWSLPGGFMGIDETLRANVMRKLAEKTGLVSEYHLEQLQAHDALNRDERGRVVTVSFVGLVHNPVFEQVETGLEHVWCNVDYILSGDVQLAFDHMDILKSALHRLKSKVMYTDIALHLLPVEFTLADFQAVSELLLGRSWVNFRRWAAPFVQPTGKLVEGNAQFRTPQLFIRSE